MSKGCEPAAIEQLRLIGEQAYFSATSNGQIEIENFHTTANCDWWASAAFRQLTAAQADLSGATISLCEWEPRGLAARSVIGIRYHRYIRIENEVVNLVVDGTWQQFLPKKKRKQAEIEQVLISSQEELARQIGKLGVKKQYSDIWNPLHAKNIRKAEIVAKNI